MNGGMQVVVEQSADSGRALGLTVMGAGLVGGVGAEQFVDDVPAGEVLGQDVSTGEFAEQAAGRGLVQAGHTGGRVRGDLCAWVQAEQPEHTRRPGCKLLIGPGEQRAHAGRRIPTV